MDEGPVLTVFRSRLAAEGGGDYEQWADRMEHLASRQPGFLEFKTFRSDDGERLSLVLFERPEDQERWRDHPEHRAAQQRGRDDFYAEYDIAVCQILRRTRFVRETAG